MSASEGILTFGLSRTGGALLLAFWLLLLVAAAALRAMTNYVSWAQPLHWFETFFRIGSTIYGGGQVVLPMLLAEMVQYNCSTDDHGKEVRFSLLDERCIVSAAVCVSACQ